MGRAERTRARQSRRAFFQDLIGLVRSARAAARREPGLAIELLAAVSFELGVARERYGENRAAIEWLRRATLRTTHTLMSSFAEPTDTGTRIALALFRANLGARKGPQRAPLRLLAEKVEVAS